MKRIALTLIVAGLVGLCGCGWNKAATTKINYEFSGRTMLHIATVPHTRPDGSDTAEARKALLDEIAARAGSYTYTEDAVGYLLKLEDGSSRLERADLLIVPGPPAVNPYLKQKLFTMFGAAQPIVATIPAASPAAVPINTTRGRDRTSPPDATAR